MPFFENEAFFSIPNETREKPEENPNEVVVFLGRFLVVLTEFNRGWISYCPLGSVCSPQRGQKYLRKRLSVSLLKCHIYNIYAILLKIIYL